MHKGQEVSRRLFVPSCYPAVLLDQVDETLHLLPFFIEMLIIGPRFFPVLLRGDHYLSPLPAGRLDDRIAVVGFVGDPRLGLLSFHQGLSLCDVGLLAGTQRTRDRVAQGIDDKTACARLLSY